ncbi:hypothetical protein Nepgr_021843 [Nepenthes gracilis]|uniref:Transcription repressor n=1 Tax=Nepenthes gracilis TaxID=150966 RepID=A0AAD3SZN9_NEPGR|nr:hypothetical protein Nepgr_021843 [Nepenthes gracilis]
MFTKHSSFCFSLLKCLPTSLSQPPPSLSSSTMPPPLNFNSAYDVTSSDHYSTSKSDDFFSSNSDSDSEQPHPPNLSAIFASPRFFVSAPGRSNSILDVVEIAPGSAVVGGGVAIRKYSPDPYTDFRRSMQEMIEARDDNDELIHGKRDWEYLHELLFSYLNLNPRHTHRFILGAFTDLVVSLLSSHHGGRSPEKRPF